MISDVKPMSSWLAGLGDEIIKFTRQLIAQESVSGQEGALAGIIASQMRGLGYDDVWIDPVGNVIGLIRGAAPGRTLLLLTHLDTAPAGDTRLWERDPFGAELEGGFIYGLGAASNKGAIAAQVYAAAALKAAGLSSGELIVASVVGSESAGCLGTQHLLDHTLLDRGIKPSVVVLGDPTGLDVCLGHRGRMEIEIGTLGRTSHPSAPWLGLNAAYKMLPVLEGIADLATALPSHPFLDKSTVAVTSLLTLPEAGALIPDRCQAKVDRRFLPGESVDTVLAQIQSVLTKVAAKDPEFLGSAAILCQQEVTYTGATKTVSKVMAPWLTNESHPFVIRAMAALAQCGQTPNLDKWYFATEGSYTSGALGILTIGYSPGEERYSHTPFDRVSCDFLMQAAAGTAAIAANLVCEP